MTQDLYTATMHTEHHEFRATSGTSAQARRLLAIGFQEHLIERHGLTHEGRDLQRARRDFMAACGFPCGAEVGIEAFEDALDEQYGVRVERVRMGVVTRDGQVIAKGSKVSW